MLIRTIRNIFGKKMELLEIAGLFEMDSGAPSPLVISNGNSLYVSFYNNKGNVHEGVRQRNEIYDNEITIIQFKRCISYTFGSPNDEALSGHPYYKLGMRSYSFYELKKSDYRQYLEDINKVHPRHDPEIWKGFRHFILTFHDDMLECIATEFEISHYDMSTYYSADLIINKLYKGQF